MHILFKWCILRQCAMLHFTHYLHDIPWIPSHLYSYFQSIFSYLGIRQRRVRDHIPEFRYSFRVFFPKKASYCLRNFSTEEEAKYSLSRFYLKWVHSYFQMYNWFSQVKKKSFKELKRTTTQYWLVSHKIASLPRKLSCKFSCARPAIKAERFRVN